MVIDNVKFENLVFAAGMSKAKVARDAGLGASVIHRIKNRASVSKRTVYALAKSLGVGADELLETGGNAK